MSEAQHKSFHELAWLFEKISEPKFMKGAKEHGGLITDLTEEQLEQAILEEIIDLVWYTMALIKVRERNRGNSDS